MKNDFNHIFHLVVEWIRPARRVQPEPRITPEQLRDALRDMLADPETRRLVLGHFVGTVFPISGAACPTDANTIGPGTFGDLCPNPGGAYAFKADVAATVPLSVMGAPSQIADLQQWKDSVGALLARVAWDGKLAVGAMVLDNNLKMQISTGPVPSVAYFAANKDGQYGALFGFENGGSLGTGGIVRVVALGDPLMFFVNNTLEAMRITSARNVGLGTTAPAEKLDVIGKIKSDGLNKIVFLRPLGAPNDDGDRINQAIDGLPDDGGIIYLLPGIYNIRTRVRNLNKRAVKLRGFGGAAIGFHSGLTVLKWDPTSTDADKFVVRLESNTTADFMQDFEVSDLTIDGNAAAQIGLYLNRISSSKFINVNVQNMARPGAPSIGIKLTSFNGAADKGCLWNLFINCSVWGATRGLVLTGERDDPQPVVANSAHNSFVGLTVGYYSEAASSAGIFLGDCDNNCLIRPWIFAIPLNSTKVGPGVLIQDPRKARSNYFYHAQSSDGTPTNLTFWVKNAEPPAPGDELPNKNLVFGYDLENGQGQPRAFKTDGTEVSPADFLYWVDSRGRIHLSRSINGLSPVLDGSLEYFGSTLNFTIGATRYQLAP